MVRKAIAPTHLLEYLGKIAQQTSCSFGLILGQPADEKDYILHFARTPIITNELQTPDVVQNVAQIPELAISEHAIYTTRMLPGGLYVLGMFIITNENIFKPVHKKLFSIMQQLQSQLGVNPWMFGNHPSSNERLILYYHKQNMSYEARTLSIATGTTNAVNFVFSEKEPMWSHLECKFDFCDIMKPVDKEHNSISLKNQLKTITASLSANLKTAIFIFDGKLYNLSDKLECIKKVKCCVPDEQDPKSICVTLLLPTTTKDSYAIEVTENAGSLQILGLIACSVWLHPSTTFEVASRAVVEDIVRSFQARLTMHFDSLTEGESCVLNDTCSLHEPPRRVEIALAKGDVTLSDYLFPGEGPQEAHTSFQEVLDVHIASKNALQDKEGQADLSGYYSDIASRDSNELPLPSLPTDTNKFMYIMGAGVAIGVLLISLLIHFLREHNVF